MRGKMYKEVIYSKVPIISKSVFIIIALDTAIVSCILNIFL